jgi:pectin methylesterase-like acyl-CoA thioesterase
MSTRTFGFIILIDIALAAAGFGGQQGEFGSVVSPEAANGLQDAVANAPDGSKQPHRIRLKPGKYQGQLIVPKSKRHMEVLGEKAEDTIITYGCKLTSDPQPWVSPQNAHAVAGRSNPSPMAYLGRPWRPYASVTFVNCEMDGHIKPEGWDNWRNPANEQTARFGEYNSMGPGGKADKRVRWSKQLTKKEADLITVETVLGGRDHWDVVRASGPP